MSIKAIPIQDVWYYMFAKDPKHLLRKATNVKRMPPKRGPTSKKTLAIETTDLPIVVSEVFRISVHLFHFNGSSYFIDSETKKLYNVVDGRPGSFVGTWNPETRTIQED